MIKRRFGTIKWVFPGGAIKPAESFETAIRREIKEDLGIELAGVSYLGEFTQTVHHRQENLHCFSSKLIDPNLKPEVSRIHTTKWFLPTQLPELTPVSLSVLALHKF